MPEFHLKLQSYVFCSFEYNDNASNICRIDMLSVVFSKRHYYVCFDNVAIKVKIVNRIYFIFNMRSDLK